jgi:hypothetical protein
MGDAPEGGDEGKGQREGTGSLDRRRRLEFAAVLELFRRGIPLWLVDDLEKEQRDMEEGSEGVL